MFHFNNLAMAFFATPIPIRAQTDFQSGLASCGRNGSAAWSVGLSVGGSGGRSHGVNLVGHGWAWLGARRPVATLVREVMAGPWPVARGVGWRRND